MKTARKAKSVYFFGNKKAEGSKDMKELLGGKGANLHEMTKMGLPVPPGFTITTEVCSSFYQHGKKVPPSLEKEVTASLHQVEKLLGHQFGSTQSPLLVSVRSGARVSMPGMMDTILNLGINDATVQGLAAQSHDERFAYDAYRRFIQMYSDVVLGVPLHFFESKIEGMRKKRGVATDSELPASDLKDLVKNYLEIVRQETKQAFPQDVYEQLWGAIGAVFGSWESARAVSYRRINKISDAWGTAVNVQAMVFGNMGDDCATGVAFTRDPATGEKRFFGEYLRNAQGEDVVAGIRTPHPINRVSAAHGKSFTSMEEDMPEAYLQLVKLYQKLEKHYRDMQDIEFTVQKGKLFLLQTRSGKRTAQAAVRIAVEMVEEKLIKMDQALHRVTCEQIEQLLHPRLDPKAPRTVIAKGLPASPGAASGEVVFSSEEAERLKKAKTPCVLVRHETSPEDISGMDCAEGILTALGGMTSHAAVVARGMGKPCVAGCGTLNIDYAKQMFTVGSHHIARGQVITLDGSTGEVMLGKIPTMNSPMDRYFQQFMKWVDSKRKLKVRANAETPNDVRVARQFGAEGVGLCRTEHMFFEPSRILAVRQMIVAQNQSDREKALEKIFPMQKEDFVQIFREMRGLPVTIRLLDPPLHEFLPHTEAEIEGLARELGMSKEVLDRKVKSLKEFNPMLGHRGCRLGVSFPEIYEMQVRAIMEAACHLILHEKFEIHPEIMIPFTTTLEEYRLLKADAIAACDKVLFLHGKYFLKSLFPIGLILSYNHLSHR